MLSSQKKWFSSILVARANAQMRRLFTIKIAKFVCWVLLLLLLSQLAVSIDCIHVFVWRLCFFCRRGVELRVPVCPSNARIDALNEFHLHIYFINVVLVFFFFISSHISVIDTAEVILFLLLLLVFIPFRFMFIISMLSVHCLCLLFLSYLLFIVICLLKFFTIWFSFGVCLLLFDE